MATRRGKSQARRNNRNSGGLPGWAWLVLGIVITLAVILIAPRYLKGDGSDGFIRPRPNPDAQPAPAPLDEDDTGLASNDGGKPAAPADGGKAADDASGKYDFYTLLPGQEVAMSDAELAASARAERERAQKQAQQAAAAVPGNGDAALPTPIAAAPADASATTAAATSAKPPVAASHDSDTRYILQAGAFGASGDAEAIKARIALLGLNARVESANIKGKTVYRVRMGPYGSASELADAKAKLANGGLPAMAIKSQ